MWYVYTFFKASGTEGHFVERDRVSVELCINYAERIGLEMLCQNSIILFLQGHSLQAAFP